MLAGLVYQAAALSFQFSYPICILAWWSRNESQLLGARMQEKYFINVR
jgi:hypothetical protein